MNVEHMALLWSKVREWLMTEWDPIGVSRWPEASDEYDNYVSEISDLLIRGEGEKELAKHLLMIERDKMGLTGDPSRASRAAARLTEFFNDLSQQM